MIWSATVAVEVDERQGTFTPKVWVQGRPTLAQGTLRVELVDEQGIVRRVVQRALPAESLGTEVSMPSFAAPDGVAPAEALHWCWDIVVQEGGVELVRWRRYLEQSNRVDAEGEIALAGPPEALRSKKEAEGSGPEAPWDERDSERLLTALVTEGALTAAERAEALAIWASTGMTVERALIESGRLSEHDVLMRYCDLTGCDFIELAKYPIEPKATAVIPDDLARDCGLMAIGFRGDLLIVATSDPQNLALLRIVNRLAHGSVYIVVAARDDVIAALEAMNPLETVRPSD